MGNVLRGPGLLGNRRDRGGAFGNRTNAVTVMASVAEKRSAEVKCTTYRLSVGNPHRYADPDI